MACYLHTFLYTNKDPDERPPSPVSADNAWIQHFDLPLLGQTSGSLSGLRFAVKDNIDVAGVPTTAACPEFAFTPSAHATVVANY